MATHECSGCLRQTRRGLVNEENDLVLPDSDCSAPGLRHTWVPIVITVISNELFSSLNLDEREQSHELNQEKFFDGFLKKLLLLSIGTIKDVSDLNVFIEQGKNQTLLRDPEHKKLKLLGRDHTIETILQEVTTFYNIANKAPIITIPAGPGQGKTEIVARIVENCDQCLEYYKSIGLSPNEWLACTVTFNFASDVTLYERQLYSAIGIGPERYYELIVSFRLIFTWFVNKSSCNDYRIFCDKLSIFTRSQKGWEYSLLLANVIALIQSISGRQKIMLFIDESLRPLHLLKAPEDVQAACISSIAQLQNKSFVI